MQGEGGAQFALQVCRELGSEHSCGPGAAVCMTVNGTSSSLGKVCLLSIWSHPAVGFRSNVAADE
jgi:hypothetical protein